MIGFIARALISAIGLWIATRWVRVRADALLAKSAPPGELGIDLSLKIGKGAIGRQRSPHGGVFHFGDLVV